MKPWWEEFSGLLEREIASLDTHGIVHEREELAWRQGQLVLKLAVPRANAEPLHLVAFYPDKFPYTRFEVVAADLDLPRHQNPFGKNLCLLGRSTENWSVTFTLGDLLTAQLPTLLRYGAEEADALRDVEELQGEPFTDHYGYFPETAVLVDSSWNLDRTLDSGRLKLTYDVSQPFRGAVVEVQDANSGMLERADDAITGLFRQNCRGRWVRWPEPIAEIRPDRILSLLATRYKALAQTNRLSRQRAVSRGQPEVIGVVFPEEISQGIYGDAWLFVVRTIDGLHLARACRAGRADLGSRAPELASLPSKRVATVGLGSLGAPSAVELARTGVGVLKLADFDFVEAGTGARWSLGLSAAGFLKVDAIRNFIARNYPYTQVDRFPGMIGRAMRTDEYWDARDLERLLDSDLIYDATAETGIQLLLSDFAADRRVPYVCVSTTSGAWGGMVFRKRPSDAACWSCLQYAMRDGTIPPPPSDPHGMLQPVGCANPTFTGAGFESQQVVLMGVRMAVSTLCEGVAGAYPETVWNVAIGRFRAPDGGVIAPQWEIFTIGQHADCGNDIAHGRALDS